jgi:hypothetical protein
MDLSTAGWASIALMPSKGLAALRLADKMIFMTSPKAHPSVSQSFV